MNPIKYQSRLNPSTIVELLFDAEFRLGEIKEKVVIYKRRDRYYVRRAVEFNAKFELVN
jgi:hypothetical protein